LKIIKKIIQYIKNILDNNDYMNEYLYIIDISERTAFQYLRKNHKIIKFKYGKKFFRECYLNYIIIYHKKRSNNLRRIDNIILTKTKHHKSDLAIISNYLDGFPDADIKTNLTEKMIQISKSLGYEIKHNNRTYVGHQIKKIFRKGYR